MSDRKRRPVVMVHGYLDLWYNPWWRRLKSYLDNFGFDPDKIRRVNLGTLPGSTIGSPREYSEEVRKVVEDVYDDHGRVSILAHSMGGVNSRWYVEKMDGRHYVDKITTLGTPHQGTYAAYLGFFSDGGQDLKPDSDLIQMLNEGGPVEGVEYNGLWGERDALLIPKTSAKVPFDTENVTNYNLGGYGHLSLILRKSLITKYLQLL
ncbi:MAG: esterase/lipase family protein [Halobacteria archaeon]